jgi:dihydroflavonol-4-reductase
MHLVTGATGHIGNVLIRQLLARGEKVRVLVRRHASLAPLQGLEVELFYGNLLEPGTLARALEGVERVYHLAARISLRGGADPETERVNLDGTRLLLAAARRAAVQRFVYASSIYALRIPAEGVVDESLPFDPEHARGVYDRSKAAASLEVQAAAAEGLDAVIVCPTAVIGPYDFRPSEAGRGLLYNIQPGIKFYVNGAYDFVDVRDVAQGFLLAAEKGRRGETYILGGNRLTVREVAETIWEVAGGWHVGLHLPDWIADAAAGIWPMVSDTPMMTSYSLAAVRSNSYISHAKAERELGYAPRPAQQAIRDATRWFLWKREAIAQADLAWGTVI